MSDVETKPKPLAKDLTVAQLRWVIASGVFRGMLLVMLIASLIGGGVAMCAEMKREQREFNQRYRQITEDLQRAQQRELGE